MSGDVAWVQIRSLDGHHCLRARVERMGARRARALSIEGAIRNLKLPYPQPRGVQERTPFDHRGHLIAARFGGPSRRVNLAAMHGLINMSGGPWYSMEGEIAAMIGDRPGQMKVTVHYVDTDLRPFAFHVEVSAYTGQRLFRRIHNANPYLSHPNDPRAQRQAEEDSAEVADDLARGNG